MSTRLRGSHLVLAKATQKVGNASSDWSLNQKVLFLHILGKKLIGSGISTNNYIATVREIITWFRILHNRIATQTYTQTRKHPGTCAKIKTCP